MRASLAARCADLANNADRLKLVRERHVPPKSNGNAPLNSPDKSERDPAESPPRVAQRLGDFEMVVALGDSQLDRLSHRIHRSSEGKRTAPAAKQAGSCTDIILSSLCRS
jgi:hypothetical protein